MNVSKFSISMIVLTVLVVVGLGYFAVLPLYNNISDAKTKKISLSQEDEQTGMQYRSLLSLNENKNDIEQYNAIADKLIPAEPNAESLTLEMEAFVKSLKLKSPTFEISGLFVTPKDQTSATPSQAPQRQSLLAGLTTHQFTLSGTTNYSGVFYVLSRFHTLSRLGEITNIELSNNISDSEEAKTSKPTGEISMRITGNFFSGTNKSSASANIDPSVLKTASTYLKNRISYSKPIIIEKESGFGRTNPFVGY